MPLNLGSLHDATASLAQAVLLSQDAALFNSLDETLKSVFTTGVIKHFEFTYELCWKFIERWLEVNVSPSVADGVTRRELFRLGAEYRLIDNVERWMDYHLARNEATHTYRKATADSVYAIVPDFLSDAQLLLTALEVRND